MHNFFPLLTFTSTDELRQRGVNAHESPYQNNPLGAMRVEARLDRSIPDAMNSRSMAVFDRLL
jgi:hypothetical protein